jgi:hypothetical protein
MTDPRNSGSVAAVRSGDGLNARKIKKMLNRVARFVIFSGLSLLAAMVLNCEDIAIALFTHPGMP